MRLVDEKVISLHDAISRITFEPAQILGIDAGRLQVGGLADVCIVDPERRWEVSENTLLSNGKNTPFLGWEMKGQVIHTLLGGKTVYEAE